MTDEKWPAEGAPYDFPDDAGAQDRWQAAVVQALEAKTLWLTHQGGDYYVLTGKCPRCGHGMDPLLLTRSVISSYVDSFTVMVNGPLRAGGVVARADDVEVVCACTKGHDGRRDEKARGCGWGRDLAVNLKGHWPDEVGGTPEDLARDAGR